MSLLILKSWWSLVQYLLRYLVWYVDFCCLVPKSTKTPCIICGVSWPIFIKIAQNVAKLCPLTPVNRNWRYSNPLRNASVLNRSFHKFCPKLVAMATSLKKSKKRSGSRKFTQIGYLSFGEKIVKIGPVYPDIIWLKLKQEEITVGKIYSPAKNAIQ